MKKEQIKFRCSGLEKAIIEKKAEHSGQSLSSYCRNVALNKSVNYKLTDEELEAYKMLTKYHNNFVSISNLLKEKDSQFSKMVADTANEIKIHLKKFQ